MSDRKPLEMLLARDVQWDRENPCNDCPFVRTSPFHEGIAANLPDYCEAIALGRFAHTCHKTDNRPDCDGPRDHDGTPQHCAGAILMLLKTAHGKDLQLPLLQAIEAGKLDVKRWARRAKTARHVFTLPELLTFYSRELGKRLAETPETPAERKKRRKDLARRAAQRSRSRE